MNNKRVLILLLLILSISGVLLLAFIFDQSKINKNPTTSNNIKNNIGNNINKNNIPKTTPRDITVGDFNSVVPKEAQITEEEFDKIKQQPVTTAVGTIISKQSDKIIVEFSHLETIWTSEVLINENSNVYLSSVNPKLLGKMITLDQLKVGEEVIVNSETPILNQTAFIALSIHKIQ